MESGILNRSRKSGRGKNLPDRKTHNKIASLFSDLPEKKIDKINKTIDSKIMLAMHGPEHRKYWGHDVRSLAVLLSMSPTDEWSEIARVWFVHVQLDKMSKKDRKKIELLAKYLE